MPEDFIGLSEAAELANCSRDTIRRAAQRGELEGKMGSGPRGPQWWICRTSLEQWSDLRETVQAQQPQQTQTVEVNSVVDAAVHQAMVNELLEKLRRADERIIALQLQASQSQKLLEERARSLQEKEAKEKQTAALAEQLKLARQDLNDWQDRRRGPWWKKILFG